MIRALIVDDSPIIVKMVSNYLSSAGVEIVGTASDGNQALEKFKALTPDVTFLDITMPNKDGRECLKGILELQQNAKVIMLSALSAPDVIEECNKLGAYSYIDKSSKNLKETLEKVIQSLIQSKAA